MIKTDVEEGTETSATEERQSWVRPAVRRQNRWFGVGVLVLSVSTVVLLANYYRRPEGGGLGAETNYDANEGEVGNDAINEKMQKYLDHKNGNPHSWGRDPGSVATNGVPGWVHQHHNHTAKHIVDSNQNNQGGEAEIADSSRNHEDDQDESEAEQAEADEQTGSDQEDAVSTWLDTTITLQDGVKYEVVDQLAHDAGAFTQGLTYCTDTNQLFESTGLYGSSSVRQLDPETGEAQEVVPMVRGHYFGEGMVYLSASVRPPNNKNWGASLVQITWKSRKGFVYNADNLTEPPEQFEYTTTNGEGWGITHDPGQNELIVTDGTNNLHFWDPQDLGNTLRKVGVMRQNGDPAKNLNELEFWRGRVLANVWFEDVLLVINPESGVVEKEYDFSQLWPYDDRPKNANVFNGISVSADPDILYVTGKKWNRMYKIKLLP